MNKQEASSINERAIRALKAEFGESFALKISNKKIWF